MKVCTTRPIYVNPDSTYSYVDGASSKEEISAVQTILNNIYSERNRAAAAQGMPSGVRLLEVTGVWDATTEEGYKANKNRVDSELEKLKKTLFGVATYNAKSGTSANSTTKNTTADLKRLQSKTYYFTTDYTTKHGVVKKGDSLTGRLSSASREPRVVFDFFEKLDPVKAEAGEGTFTIKASEIKNFATDIAPAPPIEQPSWWKKRTKMEKSLIIGGSVVLLGIVGYFTYRSIKKKA